MSKRQFIFCFIAFISINCFSQDVPVINILEAIEKNTVDYKSTGRYDIQDKTEYIDADGQYYGKSMLIILHNNSDKTIKIYIPEGLMLKSEDTVVQDMLITKPVYALLGPKQSKTYPLYAMCSEIHDKVPVTIVKYKVSKNTDDNLISIAETINQSYMQNVIGQGAVWAYTDNALEKDLKKYGATDETIDMTLNLLAKAGVDTKLAQELKFIPSLKVESNKDSIIKKLNTDLNYANTILKYKAEEIELNPVAFYSGIGAIALLVGATTFFALRNRRNKSNLT